MERPETYVEFLFMPQYEKDEIMRINEIKAELRKLRSELEFIDGQITNDQILGGEDELGELSAQDAGRLLEKNEKLMTEIIVLETLLEE